MLIRVVLAITETALRKRLARLLESPDVLVEVVETRRLLWERITRKGCDIVLANHSVVPSPDPARMKLLHELPEFPVLIIVSEKSAAEERSAFLAAGYDGLVDLDVADQHLAAALASILQRRRDYLLRYLAARPFVQATPSLEDFVSHSGAMQTFMALAARVAASDSSVLVLGETGVGKERLARAMHAASGRAAGPFVAVNCGAFSESLLESELFGHEEGAFTGAIRAHRGCFELAHRGILFLDEICDLPNHLQVKLLRALQEREIRRVGGEKTFPVDVRVMAATNRNPNDEVKNKRLREDLFYRLNVVSLTIPPLRARSEDVPDLVASYLQFLRPRVGREVKSIAPEATAALQKYSWPGNVRELINVIERAMILCRGEEITVADLPEPIVPSPSAQAVVSPPDEAHTFPMPEGWQDGTLPAIRARILEHFERSFLRYHLQKNAGRIGRTAQRIGIQPRSLFQKMKHHGLHKEDFRKTTSD
jgi:two-component system, NtrC family, response regulator AtoC